jgi:hypothetical protein
MPQINMMLANLYRKAGQERSAVSSYKEVLRQCPLALDAIIGTIVSPASDASAKLAATSRSGFTHSR